MCCSLQKHKLFDLIAVKSAAMSTNTELYLFYLILELDLTNISWKYLTNDTNVCSIINELFDCIAVTSTAMSTNTELYLFYLILELDLTNISWKYLTNDTNVCSIINELFDCITVTSTAMSTNTELYSNQRINSQIWDIIHKVEKKRLEF